MTDQKKIQMGIYAGAEHLAKWVSDTLKESSDEGEPLEKAVERIKEAVDIAHKEWLSVREMVISMSSDSLQELIEEIQELEHDDRSDKV